MDIILRITRCVDYTGKSYNRVSSLLPYGKQKSLLPYRCQHGFAQSLYGLRNKFSEDENSEKH